VLIANHLTIFHTAVSIVAAIVVVERLFPTQHAQSWIGPIGMGLCGVAMATVLFVYWEEFHLPPAPVLLAAGLLCVLLVLAALNLFFGLGGRYDMTLAVVGVGSFCGDSSGGRPRACFKSYSHSLMVAMVTVAR
jgi:hypothetical protein